MTTITRALNKMFRYGHDDEEDHNDEVSQESELQTIGSAVPNNYTHTPHNINVAQSMRAEEISSNVVFANAGSTRAACGSFRNIEVAIAFDSSFCDKYGSASAAQTRVETIVGLASQRYEVQGLCTRLQISNIEGYCTRNTDPYRNFMNDGLLDSFRGFWNQTRQNRRRDVAQLFSGTDFSSNRVVGRAYLSAVCRLGSAYGVNWITFSNDINLQANLFTHELGHGAGAGHFGPERADSGHIMNDLLNDGENGFSATSINSMNAYLGRQTCLSTSAPAPPPSPTPPTAPRSCGSGEIFIEIELQTDDYAAETSLALTRSDGTVLVTGTDLDNNRAYSSRRCEPANDCYTFTITDSVGDGICCGFGQGSFEVNVGGQRVGGGGDFEFENSVSFGQCTPPSVDVGLFLRTDAYPEESRVALTDQSTGERLWSFSFPEANTNYGATVSVDPRGCYVFEVTDTYADGLCCQYGSGKFDLSYDGPVVKSGAEFGSSVSYALGEGC
jgi:hypothetical protein